MDAALKARWVEALRSGKYKQGEGRLERNGSFCCLGVLCKEADIPITDDGATADNQSYRPIAELCGFVSVSGLQALYLRNDGSDDHRKHTFPELAAYIEEHL